LGIAWATSTVSCGLCVTGAYGNGKFAVLANDGSGAVVSNSGTYYNNSDYYNGVSLLEITNDAGSNVVEGVQATASVWTNRTAAAANNWRAIAYGNGILVAVAYSGTGNRVMTSTDGITWTSRASAADNDWYGLTFGNGLFVAVAQTGVGSGNRVMTSPDGITWTTRTSAADSSWHSVTYGNGLFVAVGSSTTSLVQGVMISSDGINWSIPSGVPASDSRWWNVIYGNGLFVAVAIGPSSNKRVMTSPDGITWTLRASALDTTDWYSTVYAKGLFVTVGATSSTQNVMTSPDGYTWTLRSGATSNTWRAVTYGNGLFVAVSLDGTSTRAMTSPDGITWTTRTSASNDAWRALTFYNQFFVSVSIDGTVMTSENVLSSYYTSNRVSLSFTTPSDSDLSSILVLKSTDPVGDTPTDGATYATSSKVGASDVVCSYAVATSTAYTCNSTSNTFNGTSYYFKIFTKDTYGNYSSQVLTASTTPGRSITLGTGTDASSTTLAPGGSATTSDTFTLVTDQGTDVLQSVTITFASGTATSTSLLEVTDNAGVVIYGSTTTPSDVTVLPLSGLTVTTATTTYKIRITPKSHVNMPDPSVGV
jgi:hypothetical protein